MEETNKTKRWITNHHFQESEEHQVKRSDQPNHLTSSMKSQTHFTVKII